MPKVDTFNWFGLFAPAGTPKAAQDKLNAEVNLAMNTPEFMERIKPLAVTKINGPAADFTAFLQRDRVNWGQVVKAAGAKLSD